MPNPWTGAVYGIQNFQHLKYPGDKGKVVFWMTFLEIRQQNAHSIPDDQAAEMLYNMIKGNTKDFEADLAQYRMMLRYSATHGGPQGHQWAFLSEMFERRLEEEGYDAGDRIKTNYIKSVSTFKAANAAKKGAPKCKFFAANGYCSKGDDCTFSHEVGSGASGSAANQKAGAKAKAKAKAKTKAQTPGPPSKANQGAQAKRPCFPWLMGLCDKTAEACEHDHRQLVDSEVPVFEKYKKAIQIKASKAKAAAKAGSKAKAKPKAKAAAKAKDQ